jgi:hypothetical protein
MKITMVILILTTLIIGKCYQTLKDKNEDFHSKIDKYQITTK